MYQEMTEKIKFKAANPPKIMKYHHYAQGSVLLCCSAIVLMYYCAIVLQFYYAIDL